jgi:predicted dienelactone hydrolase
MVPSRRRLLGAAAASAALAALAAGPLARRPFADERLPDPIDLDAVDPRRGRPVPMRLHLPRGASPRDPVPMVVFSHGIGGSRQGYAWLGRHWAAEGVASLHLQHVGSDRALWFAGSPFAVASRLQAAAQEGEAIARARDLSFALDHLLEGPLGAAVDASRIVAAGHSYGANTTLLASGARVERAGAVVDLRDERVRAAIVISAPPFYGEPDPSRILGPVAVPSLHVTCTEDVIRIPGYWSDAADRIAVFEAVGDRRKALAVFEGGSHSIFTDRGAPGGPVVNARVKAATRELTTAFLRGVFDGDDRALRDWPERHRDLVARWVAPA